MGVSITSPLKVAATQRLQTGMETAPSQGKRVRPMLRFTQLMIRLGPTMLESTETTELLLTHPLVPAGPIPTANDPDGFYPYESFCETSKRPVLKSYHMVSLENDHIRVKICPDLGGRVCSIFLKQAAA